jgi:hypothetical protein
MKQTADVAVRDDVGSDVYSRICVRRPYFALRDLRVTTPGAARCVVPVEQPPRWELAPITNAEAGRHLAILGLCAAASAAPTAGRRYYLARSARIRWAPDGPQSTDEHLVGGAVARYDSPRRMSAATRLATASGAPVVAIELGYDVLTVPAFERLFAHALRLGEPGDGAESPYRQAVPLRDIDGDDWRMSAVVVAGPADCVGHFPGCPTVPVAVLGQAMVDAAGTLVARRWLTRALDLNAHRLVSAGTPVTLTATMTDRAGSEVTVSVVAHDGSAVVADLVVRIELP